jgi:hypothetical protein
VDKAPREAVQPLVYLLKKKKRFKHKQRFGKEKQQITRWKKVHTTVKELAIGNSTQKLNTSN